MFCERGVNMEDRIQFFEYPPEGKVLFNAVAQFAASCGYSCRSENGELLIGQTESAKWLFLAGDDRSGVVTALEILHAMPPRTRECVAMILFCESRPASRKQIDGQIVLHVGNVSCGDEIVLAASKAIWRDEKRLRALASCVGRYGNKTIAVRKAPIPRWQARYPDCISVSTLAKKKRSVSCVDKTNINLLRAAIVSMIVGQMR